MKAIQILLKTKQHKITEVVVNKISIVINENNANITRNNIKLLKLL